MSRGSQVLIGIVLLLLASVMALMAMIPDEQGYLIGRLMGALVAGVLGFVCVFTWGRPLTTRIGLGVLSLSMIAMIVYILKSKDPDLRSCGFAGLIAMMSGAYAMTGYYPASFPMAQVFGTTSGEGTGRKLESVD
jgi:hypothetical protein